MRRPVLRAPGPPIDDTRARAPERGEPNRGSDPEDGQRRPVGEACDSSVEDTEPLHCQRQARGLGRHRRLRNRGATLDHCALVPGAAGVAASRGFGGEPRLAALVRSAPTPRHGGPRILHGTVPASGTGAEEGEQRECSNRTERPRRGAPSHPTMPTQPGEGVNSRESIPKPRVARLGRTLPG